MVLVAPDDLLEFCIKKHFLVDLQQNRKFKEWYLIIFLFV